MLVENPVTDRDASKEWVANLSDRQHAALRRFFTTALARVLEAEDLDNEEKKESTSGNGRKD